MTDTPLNELEAAIREGMAGRGNIGDFHLAAMEATLFVPSESEVPEGGIEFTPLVAPTPRSAAGAVVAFTDRSRITAAAAATAPFVFEATGSRLVRHLAPDLGLVIFAGPGEAAELDPATLAGLRGVLSR